eukprot:TRINITY_DN23942_c0_g1_i1.p1 TRINITY_DN23942_c0_g1~~TRINITY_DN23942_c0_g1_i1.p1  ORF type:complete len:144 (+),score=21.26 TRINITY_DN23942_c0_g1_i1:71-502(+)
MSSRRQTAAQRLEAHGFGSTASQQLKTALGFRKPKIEIKGWGEKKGFWNPAFKRRFFHLHHLQIDYYLGEMTTLRGSINLRQCLVMPIQPDSPQPELWIETSAQINGTSRTYVLRWKGPTARDDVKAWKNAVEQAVKLNKALE